MLDIFAEKAGQEGLDLVYQIDHDVPLHIIGDNLRLRQIFMNLINNAVKFTHKGEIFIAVHLHKAFSASDQGGKPANGWLKLDFEVRDTGIGIPGDKLERLFKAFSQVDSSTTRQYGGTGLGLVISKKLVELMGGDITVTSEEGTGTTFSFSIQTRASQKSFRNYVHYNAADQVGKRILVVDDNLTNRSILTSLLEQWQFIPTSAGCGSDVLDILPGNPPIDLVLTDMHMPGMDGIELATRIRERQPNLPIILLSSMDRENRTGHPGLFSSVLTKPIKQQSLYKQILISLRPQPKNQSEQIISRSLIPPDFCQEFPMRILVAEDNQINQKVVHHVLRKLGFEAEIAENGTQVINKVESGYYDLILMDVQMPVMDGLEATKIIRGRSGRQPVIIAMTANAMKEDSDLCIQAGMNDYISKPVRLEDLISLLKKWAPVEKR